MKSSSVRLSIWVPEPRKPLCALVTVLTGGKAKRNEQRKIGLGQYQALLLQGGVINNARSAFPLCEIAEPVFFPKTISFPLQPQASKPRHSESALTWRHTGGQF
jgi:hypothetical protein